MSGKALWKAVTTWTLGGAVIELRPDELVVLATACRTADTIAAIEADVAGEPLTAAGSAGQAVVHPLVVELRHQRTSLSALLSKLDLPDAGTEWDNLTASQRARKAARARWSA